MSFRATTRASSPNATAPFDPLVCLALRCPPRPVPGTCCPRSSFRLVTTLRYLVLLLRFACSPVVIPGKVTGHTSALDLFCVLPLVSPMISGAREIVERAVAVRCVRRLGAGLESVVYYGLVAAAAFAFAQQQAAARTGQVWVSGLCQGKGDRTGGRLHPGLAGERLLNNAPTPRRSLRCDSGFRAPRGWRMASCMGAPTSVTFSSALP